MLLGRIKRKHTTIIDDDVNMSLTTSSLSLQQLDELGFEIERWDSIDLQNPFMDQPMRDARGYGDNDEPVVKHGDSYGFAPSPSPSPLSRSSAASMKRFGAESNKRTSSILFRFCSDKTLSLLRAGNPGGLLCQLKTREQKQFYLTV